MEIEAREDNLAGLGRRWSIRTANGHSVLVVADTGNARRQLSIRSPDRAEADCSADLTDSQATALAGLLTGALLVTDPSE